MGVNANALLTSPPDVIELLRYFHEAYGGASLGPFPIGINAFWLSFKDGEDSRQLSVFMPGECASDYADVCEGPAILISMGCWGNSEAIARRVVTKFGGLIRPNDCRDDWQEVGPC